MDVYNLRRHFHSISHHRAASLAAISAFVSMMMILCDVDVVCVHSLAIVNVSDCAYSVYCVISIVVVAGYHCDIHCHYDHCCHDEMFDGDYTHDHDLFVHIDQIHYVHDLCHDPVHIHDSNHHHRHHVDCDYDNLICVDRDLSILTVLNYANVIVYVDLFAMNNYQYHNSVFYQIHGLCILLISLDPNVSTHSQNHLF